MMPRMQRRRFTILLSALWLLLCAVVVVLWVMSSGDHPQRVRLSPGRHYYSVESATGGVSLFENWAMHDGDHSSAKAINIVYANDILTVPHCVLIALLLFVAGIRVWMMHRHSAEGDRLRRWLCTIPTAVFRAHIIASYVLAVIVLLIAAIFHSSQLDVSTVFGLFLAPLRTVGMLRDEASYLLFRPDMYSWAFLPSRHWATLGYVLLLTLASWLPYRRQRQQRRRLATGLCLHCGYDLRASEERCPECGTPLPAGLARRPVA